MNVGDKMYYCLVVPNCNIYEVLSIVIRTVQDNWAVGVDVHTKQAYLFSYNMIGSYVFKTQYEAQEAILQFRAKEEKDDIQVGA